MKFICLNGCNCNDDNDNADDNDIMIVIAIVVVIVIMLMQLLTLKLAGGGFVEPPLGFFSLSFYPSTNCQMLLHNCSLIMKTSFDTN